MGFMGYFSMPMFLSYLLSSRASESQCRSSSIAIYNITSIILILILITSTSTFLLVTITITRRYDTKGNAVSFEFDTVAALLKSVREGSIHGRIKPHTDSDSKNSSSLPDDIIPEDEFTLPEMVEGICR